MPSVPPDPTVSFEAYRTAALARMKLIRDAFWMGLGGIFLLNTETMFELEDKAVYLQGDNVFFYEYPLDKSLSYTKIDFGMLVFFARSQDRFDDYSKIYRELGRGIRRTFLNESFEAIQSFADRHKIYNQLDVHTWYQYASVIRNSMSHDFHIHYTKTHKKHLPITWDGIALTIAMEGDPLEGGLFPSLKTLHLHKAMVGWLERCRAP